MGIKNLSLKLGPNFAQEGTVSGTLVHENKDNEGARDLRIVWSTEQGVDWIDYWHFSVDVAAYGWVDDRGTYYMGRTDLGNFTADFKATECNAVRPDGDGGRVWWSHRLNFGTMLDTVNNGHDTWMYSWRGVDTFSMKITLWGRYKGDYNWNGSDKTPVANATMSIGFCPTYRLTGINMTADAMEVNYSTTWRRTDDRFFAHSDADGTQAGCAIMGTTTRRLLRVDYNSTVDARGRLSIPIGYLAEIPNGESVYLNIPMNASYRPSGSEFARIEGTVDTVCTDTCSDVVLRLVSYEDGVVTLRAYSLHNNENDCDGYRCTMGGFGDTRTAPIGETVQFEYAPFGTTVHFMAVGTTEEGAVSENTSNIVYVDTDPYSKTVIDGPDMGMHLEVDYVPSGSGKALSLSFQREYDTVKLAGRQRPTVGYGTGGSKSISFSAVVMGDAMEWEDFFDYNSNFIVRFPDGRRYNLAGSVKMTKITDSVVDGLWTVDVSGDEVEM